MPDNPIDKIFLDAAELLSDPIKWTKGTIAKSAKNRPVLPTSEKAICWCMMGALQKYSPDNKSWRLVANRLNTMFNIQGLCPAYVWNDTVAKTNFDVVAKLKEAAQYRC